MRKKLLLNLFSRKTTDNLDTYDIILEGILQKSEISKETYMNALKISQRGNMLVPKRYPNEMHINSYNLIF